MRLSALLKHVSIYSAGSLLVAFAGFISFPILTRVFSVADYGILNLVSATLLLLVAIAKLGHQHAIVRFYGSVAASREPAAMDRFATTAVGMMLMSAGVVTVIWLLLSQLLPQSLWNDGRVRGVFLLTAALVLIRTLESALNNIMRAAQRSAAVSLFAVLKRYCTLLLAIGAVLLVAPTLTAFYSSTLLAEGVLVIVLFAVALRRIRLSPSAFSPSLARSMLAFGIPMIGFELAAIALNIGDRYALQLMLGADAVGLYSAAHNLCQYVQAILVSSMAQAVLPMYLQTWENEGRERTEALLESTLYYYIVVGMPAVFGMWVVAPELLRLLASEQYVDSAAVVPWVMGGMGIDGIMPMLMAGLYIAKKSKVVLWLVGGAALLNVVLNVALIPIWGIIGSAVATLASATALAIATAQVSSRYLTIRIPMRDVVTSLGASAVMWIIASRVELEWLALTLLAKVVVGASVYVICLLALSGRARDVVRAFVHRVPG
jgi:O-antigen/teichoic acid export membrane protein